METVLKKGKVAYEVEVSDISDGELVDTVNSVEKGIKDGRTNSFEIFRTNRRRRACAMRKVEAQEEKLHLNPPRSDQEMMELRKRRWVRHYIYLQAEK